MKGDIASECFGGPNDGEWIVHSKHSMVYGPDGETVWGTNEVGGMVTSGALARNICERMMLMDSMRDKT